MSGSNSHEAMLPPARSVTLSPYTVLSVLGLDSDEVWRWSKGPLASKETVLIKKNTRGIPVREATSPWEKSQDLGGFSLEAGSCRGLLSFLSLSLSENLMLLLLQCLP